jgi:hypothetical protein
MKRLIRFLAIHLVTSAATVGILTVVPIIGYAGMVVVTNDRGGDLLWLMIPVFFSSASALLTGFIYFPMSALADYTLVKRLKLRWWFHLPLAAIIFFLFGFGSLEILVLVLLPKIYPTYRATDTAQLLLSGTIFGLLVMFGGIPYWFILRFLSSTMQDSKIAVPTAKSSN